MPVTLTVKGVPDDMLERLRERAKRNHRSLQGELMAIVEEAATQPRKLTVQELYDRGVALGLHTGDEATRWIREDRDAR